MSDLLTGLKTERPTGPKSESPVPLEELLLSEYSEDEAVAQVQQVEVEDTAAGSRRARRQKLKSNRVIHKAKTGTPRKIQDKANKRRQDRNVQNLLKRQSQSDQTRETKNQDTFVGGVRGKLKKQAPEEPPAKDVVLRPVMLGSIEFSPLHKNGSSTPEYSLLRIKRAARRVKVDRQPEAKIENVVFSEPPLNVALSNYSDVTTRFRDSLPPSRIGMYDEALAAFGLSVNDGVSVTEVLYTLVSEYGKALASGTSRLDESSDRDIEQGTSLVENKDERISLYRESLRSSDSSCYDSLITADDDDIEVSLKCMLSLMAKEVLTSYNSLKYNSNESSGDDIPRGSSWSQNLLMSKPDSNALTTPASLSTASGGLTYKTAHGVSFSNFQGKQKKYNYPFELSQVLSSTGTQVLTSTDFIDLAGTPGLYVGVDIEGRKEEYLTPYAATSSGFNRATDIITRMFETTDIGNDDSYFLSFLDDILTKLGFVLPSARYLSNNAVYLQAMVEAAESKSVLDEFIIYLAFRQEMFEGYTGEGDPLPGPATLVRKSSRLRSILGSISTGKKTTTMTQTPRQVSITPDPEGSGTKTFTNPDKKTTITTKENVSSSDSGTLESLYDISFDEVCERFSKILMTRFRNNSSSGFTVDSSKTKSVPVSNIKSALSSPTNTILEGFFAYESAIKSRMAKINDEEPDIFSSGKSYLSSYNQSAFSVFYILTFCKLTKLLIGDRFTITMTPSLTTSLSALGMSSILSTPSITSAVSSLGSSLPKFASVTSVVSSAFNKTTGGETASIKFATNYNDSYSDVGKFLSADEGDTSDIDDSFPVLSSVISSLSEEEKFLREFAGSLHDFFSGVEERFEEITEVLGSDIGSGKTLNDFLKSGTKISRDMTKTMKSLAYSLNTADMNYNGVKLRDKTTSWPGFRLLRNILFRERYIPQKKQKVICVGIPTGLIERTRYEPAEISEVSGFDSTTIDESVFKIVVEKVDLTDPDVKYKDLEFSFSRDLFCLGADVWSSFLKINDDLRCTKITRTKAIKEFGHEIVNNHLADFGLKQYADLQFNLDFSELAFVNNGIHSHSEINIPAMKYVDTTSLSFLSSSNIAFDPQSRRLSDFDFYTSGKLLPNKLDLSDEYQYSAFELISSFGALFVPEYEQERLTSGLLFERTLCIPVDDDAFELDFEDEEGDEQTSQESAAIKSKLISQEEVSVGVETSQGVDMFTYRVSLKVGEEV